MGEPAKNRPGRATYADLEAVPDHLVAEILRGVLHTFPRPAAPHARASTRLNTVLGGPFDLGVGGPGGWVFIFEPELHLGPDPDVLIPDVAGWRRERMPRLPKKKAHFTLPPDWVCEVLSPSTARVDREEKMPIYAREGVTWLWLIDPLPRKRSLVVHRLGRSGEYTIEMKAEGDAVVRAPPFEEVAFSLALLWAGQDDDDDEAGASG